MFPIVPHHQREPSPRAKDLGRRLAEAIREFEHSYPGTSAEDLRAAFQVAVEQTGHRPRALRARVAIAVGAIAVALGVGLAVSQGAGSQEGPVPWVFISVAAVAALAAVAIRLRD
jgi:fatty acid desaturase